MPSAREMNQVNMAGCEERSKLSFDDDTYELINVHVHSVSEHSVSVVLRDARVTVVGVVSRQGEHLCTSIALLPWDIAS